MRVSCAHSGICITCRERLRGTWRPHEVSSHPCAVPYSDLSPDGHPVLHPYLPELSSSFPGIFGVFYRSCGSPRLTRRHRRGKQNFCAIALRCLFNLEADNTGGTEQVHNGMKLIFIIISG